MQYYGICANPNELSDSEWALRYAILEDIRNREKAEAVGSGRIQI